MKKNNIFLVTCILINPSCLYNKKVSEFYILFLPHLHKVAFQRKEKMSHVLTILCNQSFTSICFPSLLHAPSFHEIFAKSCDFYFSFIVFFKLTNYVFIIRRQRKNRAIDVNTNMENRKKMRSCMQDSIEIMNVDRCDNNKWFLFYFFIHILFQLANPQIRCGGITKGFMYNRNFGVCYSNKTANWFCCTSQPRQKCC